MDFNFSDPNFLRYAGNTLSDIGYGVAQGGFKRGFGVAAERQNQMEPYRQQEKLREQSIKKQQDQLNAAADAMIKFGGDPRYADAVRTGAMDPTSAWNAVLTKSTGPTPIEINGQLVDPSTGKVIGDYRTPEQPKPPSLTEVSPGATMYDPTTGKAVYTAPAGGSAAGTTPSGYRMTSNGGLEAIPGGPYDPSNPLNVRKITPPPSPTLQKEIIETDEQISAGQNVLSSLDEALKLNDKAWDGPMADLRSSSAALFGNEDAVTTQTLKNIVTSNALESLKATFGAAPTEGERQILLEVQGSIDQPKAVREAIFKRAKAAAERRLQQNAQKAAGLRSGEYFDAGYGGGQSSIDDLVNKYQ